MTVTAGPRGESFAAEFALPPDFAGFRGHFAGNPVMPGVCIIAAVLLGAETTLGCPLRLARLTASKFYSPVLPNLRVDLEAAISAHETGYQVKARLSAGGRKVAAVTLLVERRGAEANP
jgi:3-hydroxyacyl-[acyl-carrier-protein] dehydratase